MFAICSADDSKMCLVEGYLFLMLNGFWIGMYFFVNDYVFGNKRLYFPVVQQFKFLQVKAELQSLMKQAMIDSLSPSVYFVVIYYWNGGAIRGYISDILECNVEEKSQDTILGLMNTSELFYLWLFSSIFIFTIYNIKLMLRVNLTEHIFFPITSLVGNSNCLTLHQSLAMSDVPIIQYLGFLDLKVLAEKDYGRREQLFTLSHPGGHPYNWNAVVEETLKLIRKFTEDINKANTETKPAPESNEYVITKDYSPSKSFAIASSENQGTFVSGMRNMSLRVHNMSDISLCQSPSNFVHFQPRPFNVSQESILTILRLYSTQALDALCRKPGISFIFGDLPDAKVRYHLAQCQPVIWAIQGLSCLAAASFKEDHYGVVQKDLPAIITSVLQLKQSLDRLQKVGNYKRSQKTEHHDMKMKAALRSAVKQSLYTVCVTFGEYVKDMSLSKEVLQQIQHFLNFREG
jgi:nucleoporin NDC1